MNENYKVYESELKAIREEITAISEINRDIRELCLQIKGLTVEMKHMKETQMEHDTRIKTLEEKPNKKYDLISSTVLTSIISAVIAFIVAYLNLK